MAAPTLTQAQTLKLPTTIYLSAAGYDGATTYYAMKEKGFHENNPLLKGMGPETTVLVGAAIAVGGVVLVNSLAKGKVRKVARVGLYLGAIVHIYFGTRNIRRIQDAQ